DFKKNCLDNQIRLQTVLEIPYFDGDFWPIMIENNIEKLDQEDRRKQEAEDLHDSIQSDIQLNCYSNLDFIYYFNLDFRCNICRQQCDIRYHCTKCEDFDPCEKHYNTELKHKHNMERRIS
ncbi:unnamed protein product, partial [Rotaria magnacalcarata]